MNASEPEMGENGLPENTDAQGNVVDSDPPMYWDAETGQYEYGEQDYDTGTVTEEVDGGAVTTTPGDDGEPGEQTFTDGVNELPVEGMDENGEPILAMPEDSHTETLEDGTEVVLDENDQPVAQVVDGEVKPLEDPYVHSDPETGELKPGREVSEGVTAYNSDHGPVVEVAGENEGDDPTYAGSAGRYPMEMEPVKDPETGEITGFDYTGKLADGSETHTETIDGVEYVVDENNNVIGTQGKDGFEPVENQNQHMSEDGQLEAGAKNPDTGDLEFYKPNGEVVTQGADDEGNPEWSVSQGGFDYPTEPVRDENGNPKYDENGVPLMEEPGDYPVGMTAEDVEVVTDPETGKKYTVHKETGTVLYGGEPGDHLATSNPYRHWDAEANNGEGAFAPGGIDPETNTVFYAPQGDGSQVVGYKVGFKQVYYIKVDGQWYELQDVTFDDSGMPHGTPSSRPENLESNVELSRRVNESSYGSGLTGSDLATVPLDLLSSTLKAEAKYGPGALKLPNGQQVDPAGIKALGKGAAALSLVTIPLGAAIDVKQDDRTWGEALTANTVGGIVGMIPWVGIPAGIKATEWAYEQIDSDRVPFL